MREALQVIFGLVVFGLALGVIYGAGALVLAIGAALGIAALVVFGIALVLYFLKEWMRSWFKPTNKR